jgi:cytidyltransferase-like protein
MVKKVFVSGFFDLLHSGHIDFFQKAAGYGDLYVAVGSDITFFDLKGQAPVNAEEERLFMVQNVACVKQAAISRGLGMLDFLDVYMEIKPDIFIVNEDGNIPDKQDLCQKMGAGYIVLPREPRIGLTARSSTDLRAINRIPYRIDMAGGWLDQPYVSKYYPGPVITFSLEPTVDFNERSGMASSTRRKAIELWGPRLPVDDDEKVAKILFCYDNPPGTKEISGSQDAIGIVFPGLNKAWYENAYWPARIESIQDELTLQFIEQSLYLIPLGPRQPGFHVLNDTRIDVDGAKALSDAAEWCWAAMLNKDIKQFGQYTRASFEAQIAMFPHMMNETLGRLIQRYKDSALGWKVSGAGGGGYLILVSDKPIENALRILIRRKEY